MGGRHTVERIVYQTDPATLKQLEKLRLDVEKSKQELAKAYEEAKQAKDPKLYKTRKEEIFKAYLANLEKYQFTDKLPKDGCKNHIIMGPISVGKSSLLNCFLNLNLPVGRGETTLQASKVASNGKVNIIDSPGANDDFDFYDIDTLSLFKSADRVFLLYTTSLKDVKDIMRILSVIKRQSTFLVRTQCDMFNSNDAKSLQQEIQTDKKYVRDTIGFEFPVFATSSARDNSFADNAIVKKLISQQ